MADLFLLARKKNISVASAIVQGTWMVGLQRISSALQLRQFIGLWLLLRDVQLTVEPDKVSWRWTPNLQYSASSAYLQALAIHRMLCDYKVSETVES